MANDIITAFNRPPYYDDFNTPDLAQNGLNVWTKNYHRILFQPTYAIQTRELNQLQSLLQNQIAQLGLSQINAYYGAQVIDGETNMEDNVNFIDVTFDNPYTQDVENNFSNIKFIETRELNTSTNEVEPDLTAEILSIKLKSNDLGDTGENKYRIWFRYTNEGKITGKKHFTLNDIIYIKNDIIPDSENTPIQIPEVPTTTAHIQYQNEDNRLGTNNNYGLKGIARVQDRIVIVNGDEQFAADVGKIPVGYGFLITVAEGVFLIKGSFVHTFSQTYYYVKTDQFEKFDGYMSFIIEESIVTAQQDSTLLDNANGTYNYAAPGADRYTIKLTLALNTNDQDIHRLNKGINPIFDSKVDTNISYINLRTIIQNSPKDGAVPQSLSEALIEDQARRTFEESGNYTIRPFIITPREFLNENGSGGRYTLREVLQNNPFGIKEIAYEETSSNEYADWPTSTVVDVREYTYETFDNLQTGTQEETDLNLFRRYLESKIVIDVDPSVGYVDGRRVEIPATRSVLVDKARETTTTPDLFVSMPRGNYINLVYDPGYGTSAPTVLFSATSFGKYFKNIQYMGVVTASDVTNGRYPADQQGWLKFRVYVYNDFDVTKTDNNADLPGGFEYKLTEESIQGTNVIEERIINNPRENYSVFPLKYLAIKEVSNVEYVIQKVLGPVGPTSVDGLTYEFQINGTNENELSGTNALNITLFNSTTNTYMDAVSKTNSVTAANGKITVVMETPGVNDDFSLNDQLSIIGPVVINDSNGYYRKSKTFVPGYTEQLTVQCNNPIIHLDKQDVNVYTIKAYSQPISDPNKTELKVEIVDDGYHTNFYDNPIVKFPEISGSGTTTVYVQYDYFQHTNEDKHYFTVNSYPIGTNTGQISLKDVPEYGNSYLSDFIDFRVRRIKTYDPTTKTYTYSLSDNRVPIRILPNSIGEFTLEHYIPRIDTLSLATSSDIIITRGKSSLDPFPPKENSDKPNLMPLYHLRLRPYTYTADDIRKRYIDNNRYTMRDIGRLEKRISNLEYYSSLSLLEKEAKDRSILDLEEGGGVERFKNGILVDSFSGHNVGDISNPDYLCAVNTTLKTMGPAFRVNNHRLRYTGFINDPTGSSQDFESVVPIVQVPTIFKEYGSTFDGLTHYDFRRRQSITKPVGGSVTETGAVNPGWAGIESISLWEGGRRLFQENLMASETISVQPYEVTTWIGRITLSPTSDEWIDTERLPPFSVDFSAFENYFDAVADWIIDIYGTNETILDVSLIGFSSSQSSETGGVYAAGGQLNQDTTTTQVDVSTYEREILVEWLTKGVTDISIDFGDRVVDTSIIPWIRSRDVEFKGSGFRPNTRLYTFFDNQNVSAYVSPSTEFVPFSYTTNVDTYNGQSPDDWTEYAFGQPLVTDENGQITGVFRIPNNEEFAFRTGNREFKLIDNEFNNAVESDTYGVTQYHANGLLQSKEQSVASIRIPTFEYNSRIDIEQFQVVNVTETVSTETWDPVAQTFYVDESYPNGIYLSDVDIYFATVPEDPNITVSVYLVPCENGIPTTLVLPGSEVTVRGGDIPASQVTGRYIVEGSIDDIDFGQIAEDPIINHPTRFTFDYPVYLKSGKEYAVVVFGLSPDFRIWTSLLSGVDLNTNTVITRNPSFGVFLKSQNKRTWTPDQYRDMTIRLHQAVFPTNKTIEFKYSTLIPAQGSSYNPLASNGNDQGVDEYIHTYFQLYFKTLELTGTRLDFEVNYKGDGGGILNETIGLVESAQGVPLKTQIENPKYIEVDARLTTFDEYVTPMVDSETGSITTRSNIINDLSTGEGATYDFRTNSWSGAAPNGGDALARYITKKVVLNNASEDLRVILAVNRPSGNANIRVFAKRKPAEIFERSLAEEVDWYEMSIYSINSDIDNKQIPINPNLGNYSEVEYILPNPAPDFNDEAIGADGFTEFSIKVVFTSSDAAQVCKIKNLSSIASI